MGEINKETALAKRTLAALRALASGKKAVHYFRGLLNPEVKDDIQWAHGLAHVYIRQYETGLTCLLCENIDELRVLREQLKQRYSAFSMRK